MQRILLVLLIAWLVEPCARAQEGHITIPTDDYDHSVYAANAVDRVSRERAYDKTLVAQMVLQIYRSDPGADPNRVLREANELQARYDQQKRLAASSAGYQAFSHSDLFQAEMLFELASDIPDFKEAASFAKKLFDEKIYNINQELAPEAQITAQAEQYKLFSYMTDLQNQTWTDVAVVSGSNSAVGGVIDQLFATYLGAKTSDKATSIYINNPAFQQSEVVKYMATAVQQNSVDLKALKAAYQRDMAKLLSSVQKSQQEADAAKKKQQKENQEKKRLEDIDKNAKEREMDLDAARAGVVIFAKFIPDKKLAADVTVSGNAAILVLGSVGKYSDMVAKNPNNMKVAALSSVVLTADLLSAFTSVMSLFADPAQTPDQIIMSELRDIRETVSKMREEMNFRFDRVDITLVQIYDGLLKNLARIDYDVGKLNGRVEDVQTSLLQLSSQLDHVQRSLFEYLTDLSARMTNKSLTYCLEFTKLYAPATLGDEDYRRCQSDFLTWAVNDSKDRLASPVTDIYAVDFSNQVRPLPLASKINLLAYVVSQFDRAYLIPTERLANPLVWATGAEAYMQMAQQYPKYYNEYPLEGIKRLIATGEDLDAFIAAITLTGIGKQKVANRALLKNLVVNYRRDGADLASAMELTQKDFVIHEAAGIDLWKGPDQKTDYAPSQLAYPVEVTLGGAPTHLPLAANIKSLVPVPVLNAERLGLGTIRFTLEFSVVNTTYSKLQGFPAYNEYGSIRATLTGKFDGKTGNEEKIVFRRGFDTANYQLCPTASPAQPCDASKMPTLVNNLYTKQDNIQDSLATKSFDLSGADAPTIAKNVDEIKKDTAKYMSLLRKSNSSNQLAAFGRSDALQGKSQLLNGSIDLIDLYVAFVLPQSLESNDELRGALFGNARIVDGQVIQENLTLHPEANPIAHLRADIDHRAAAFLKIVDSILDNLQNHGTHETQPLIATTLLRLKRMEGLHAPTGVSH